MRKLICFFTLYLGVHLYGQNALKSFQWRDHLPYDQTFSISYQGNTIYAAANECVFSYNKADNALSRLNKTNGLSDIEPILVRNNPYNNALLIVYKNGNIDVLKNGTITNIPDLLNKQGINNKNVNEITFKGANAYLACAFGIAVFNTDALQFQDTYIIGAAGSYTNVYQVAFSADSIYAATATGLLKASINASNLASFTNWAAVSNLPTTNVSYTGVVNFNNSIIACYSGNYSPNPPPSNTNIDTLYMKNNSTGAWTKFPFGIAPDFIKKIKVSDDNTQFMFIDNMGFKAYNTSGANLIAAQYGFPANSWWTFPMDMMPDPTSAGWYWQADKVYGLLSFKNTTTDKPLQYQINGPTGVLSAKMQIQNNHVIAGSNYLGYQNKYNTWSQTGAYSFNNGTWKTVNNHATSSNLMYDVICTAFDNNDDTHYYAGSFNGGLLEMKNDSLISQYNGGNSAIPYRNFPGDTWTQVTALCSDYNNNLWIGCDATPQCITVKKNDGTWTNLNFSNLLGSTNSLNVNQLVVDSNNMVWLATFGNGIVLYQKDNNYSQPNTSNSINLVNIAGKGGLPTNNIISLAMDKNNNMWAGTDQGIYVFYNPTSILTQASGWDAQPIYVTQNGQTQLLLQTSAVTSIFVDGGNYKWVGTTGNGLFYFSPDGQTQIYHFTTQNSPLFSNNIVDVHVNGKTGEVFISTDKGIQSFQNIIQEGNTSFENVYAYPNPVKPNYAGPILIHGMMAGATVKIVDEGGNFVYETTSQGGQAVWYAQNEKGQRVKSGIYMAICALPDGSQKQITKIMVMN
ncbi:MAG: hypothetical protein JST67_08255 [Bacteroidetes bacterium]|nr:hypothetical protein [Bacteroidota bacterium]